MLGGDGTGTLYLSGSNTYGQNGGGTIVNAGLLVVSDGGLASGSSLSVGDTGALSTFGGPVLLEGSPARDSVSGGAVRAGAGAGHAGAIVRGPWECGDWLSGSAAAERDLRFLAIGRTRWHLHFSTPGNPKGDTALAGLSGDSGDRRSSNSSPGGC